MTDERIWKKSVAYFKVLFWYLRGGAQENHERPQSRQSVSGPRFEPEIWGIGSSACQLIKFYYVDQMMKMIMMMITMITTMTTTSSIYRTFNTVFSSRLQYALVVVTELLSPISLTRNTIRLGICKPTTSEFRMQHLQQVIPELALQLTQHR